MKNRSFFVTLFFSIIAFTFLCQFTWHFDKEIFHINDSIKKGKSLEAPNMWGITPLAGAAAEGELAMVELLLDNGAKINAKTKNPKDLILEAGNTPLHFACLRGNLKVIELLIKRKADIFALNDNKNTVAYSIVSSDISGSDKVKALRIIFKNQSDKSIKKLLNMQNKQGYTFLMRAVERKHDAEILLQNFGRYCDFSLKNKKGKSAYEIVEPVDDSIADMLLHIKKKSEN